jgi:hypothetical protein
MGSIGFSCNSSDVFSYLKIHRMGKIFEQIFTRVITQYME